MGPPGPGGEVERAVSFKAAVICSTAIHVGFLGLRPPAGLVPLRQTLYPLEVTYVIVQDERPARGGSPPPKRPDSRPADPAKAAPQPPPAKGREPVKPPELPKPQRPGATKPPSPPEDRATPPRGSNDSSDPLPPTGAGAAALPEGEFAAIRHKELVREHLRRTLRYPEDSLQGTVRLRVTLLPDGGLREAAVLAATDARLGEIALRDARSAGPYPRFPGQMRSASVEYEFLVQYRPGESSL